MTRDRIIIGAVVLVVLALAITKKVVTAQTFLLFGAVIPSIILHEVSHGVVALGFGDDTAQKAGRITLNPLPHIDLFGTLILPAILALSGLGVFGYAKPVPITPNRMRHPRDDAVAVSLAGPATNALLAIIAGLWLRQQNPPFLALTAGPWPMRTALAFGLVNVVLAVFNLLPIPPLDGSSVIERFLPKSWQHGWENIRRYGFLVLLAVILFTRGTLLDRLFTPTQNLWLRLISR